jgi:chemotaxis protein MotB
MTGIGVDGTSLVHRMLRTGAMGLLAVVVLASVGCSDNAEQTIALLEAENEEYLAENEQLKRDLATVMGQRDQLVTQNRDLVAENDKLRADMAAMSERTDADWNIEGVTGRVRPGEIVAEVAGDTLFASGSVALRNEAKRTLDSIAQALNSRYATNKIRIEGHTDSDPIVKSAWKTNDRLSAERAMAVKTYLESKGVAGDRMYIAGFGDARPRGSKAQSRRVEIVVLSN